MPIVVALWKIFQRVFRIGHSRLARMESLPSTAISRIDSSSRAQTVRLQELFLACASRDGPPAPGVEQLLRSINQMLRKRTGLPWSCSLVGNTFEPSAAPPPVLLAKATLFSTRTPLCQTEIIPEQTLLPVASKLGD